jgi:hypothetical protein
VFPTFSGLPMTPSYTWFFYFSLIITFIINRKYLLKKTPYSLFLLLIVHFIYLFFDVYNVKNQIQIIDFCFPFLIVNVLFNYYLENQNHFFQFSKIVVVGLITTIFTTFISSTIYPDAARQLAGQLAKEGNDELISFYMMLGIGDYSFSFYWLLIGLISTYCWRNRNRLSLINNNNNIILSTILLFGLYMIQYTTTLILYFVGIYIIIFGKKLVKKFGFILFSVFTIIGFYLIRSVVVISLFAISNILSTAEISPRLKNIATRINSSDIEAGYYAKDDSELEIDNRYIGGYERRAQISINSFYKNPFFGGGQSGGHNFYLDNLGMFGLFGTSILFLVLYHYFRRASEFILKNDPEYYFLFKVIVLIVFLLGIVKTYIFLPFVIFVFFFVPFYLIKISKVN